MVRSKRALPRQLVGVVELPRIVDIRESAISLRSEIRNAWISFADMDASIVALVSDVAKLASRIPARGVVYQAAHPGGIVRAEAGYRAARGDLRVWKGRRQTEDRPMLRHTAAQAGTSSTASSMAWRRLSSRAMPIPAISNAVP